MKTKKIPFDISFRDKIENGEVQVVTRDGREMKAIWFDVNYHGKGKMIVAQNETDCVLTDENGHACENGEPNPDDLFLLVEDKVETLLDDILGGTKVVNLETEIGHWFDKLDDKYCQLVDRFNPSDIKDTARYFFSLGLKTKLLEPAQKQYQVYRVDCCMFSYAMDYKLIGAESPEDLVAHLDKTFTYQDVNGKDIICDTDKDTIKEIKKYVKARVKLVENLFTTTPYVVLDGFAYYE